MASRIQPEDIVEAVESIGSYEAEALSVAIVRRGQTSGAAGAESGSGVETSTSQQRNSNTPGRVSGSV